MQNFIGNDKQGITARALEIDLKYTNAYDKRGVAYGKKKEYVDGDSVLRLAPNDTDAKRYRQMDIDAMNGR